MHNEGNEIHVDDTEASGGSKEGVVRWVLIGSTLLAIILMSLVWIIPAMTQGDIEEEVTMTGNIESMDGETGTDSIVGVEAADDIEAGEDDTNNLDTIENE